VCVRASLCVCVCVFLYVSLCMCVFVCVCRRCLVSCSDLCVHVRKHAHTVQVPTHAYLCVCVLVRVLRGWCVCSKYVSICTHTNLATTTEQVGPPQRQHTATHCNTLQQATSHFHTLPHTASLTSRAAAAKPLGEPLQHTEAHRNPPQHIATSCNTLQHTATHTSLAAAAKPIRPPASRGDFRAATDRVHLYIHTYICM